MMNGSIHVVLFKLGLFDPLHEQLHLYFYPLSLQEVVLYGKSNSESHALTT